MKYWKVPKMWENGECYIIGGGTSILQQLDIPDEMIKKIRNKECHVDKLSPYFSELHNKHVIGINMAYKLGTWIDIIFFGDNGGFFLPNIRKLIKHPALKVSCSPQSVDYTWVKSLQRDKNKVLGLSNNNGKISWNNNSGGAAINLAVHTGVKKIVLLGYDMNLSDDKQQHWHNEYKRKTPSGIKNTFSTHLKCFKNIARDARRLKVEILNANINSAINDFQKVNLKDIL